jgi:hypothetical protein
VSSSFKRSFPLASNSPTYRTSSLLPGRYGNTGKHKTHRECFDHLDYAPFVVELVLRRGPDLGEVAAAVVLRRWSLRRRICELIQTIYSRPAMLTDVIQVAVLAQGTTIYLALTRLHLGSTPEDYVVNEYESWMEVRLAMIIDHCGSLAESNIDAVCQPDLIHPQHGLVQMLDNIVPPQTFSKQEA